jgi:hypothetical protein
MFRRILKTWLANWGFQAIFCLSLGLIRWSSAPASDPSTTRCFSSLPVTSKN